MAITRYQANYDNATQQWVLDRSNPGVTYVGRVVRVFREDYRAMSDIYTLATFAEVITENGELKRVLVNANFECDVSGGHAEVDAAPEVLAILEGIRQKQRDDQARRDRMAADERILAELNRPVKGKRMVVTRGRKVMPGTTGVVFYIRDGRVGLDVTGKKDAKGYVVDPVWVNAEYLKAE